MSDPFTLLGLPFDLDLDRGTLEKRHRELSRALHPDKYVGAGASERRLALSRAASVNEAFRTLRDPIRRAEALFVQAGVTVGERSEPKADPAFLFEVMEQREALADARAARDRARIEALARTIGAEELAVTARLSAAVREAFALEGEERRARLAHALPDLGKLRYFRRFLYEVRDLDDA